MKNLLQPLLILTIFFITLFYFDTPEEYNKVNRTDKLKDSCMLSDKMHHGIIKQINQEQPDIILLGNSMLGEGVGDQQLSKLLGLKALKVWNGGSASAWWYLTLKNIFPKCKHRPRYIGIFFRDTFLTLPKYRVNGKYKIVINNFARKDDIVLDRLAYLDDQSFVKYYMKYYFPLYRDRTDLRNSFDLKIEELVEKITGAEQTKPYMKSCFSQERLNKDLVNQSQLQAESFKNSKMEERKFTPTRSFLPHMIEESKKLGVKIFFVRVKRLRDLDPEAEPEEVKQYINQLSSYLAEENIPFLDFTHQPGLKKEHYIRGDHLTRGAGRTLFTRLLAERINQDILTPGRPPNKAGEVSVADQIPAATSSPLHETL
ncbi:MAG: hypothetical protein OEM02_15110 [Desulfobulbaceae bacterium]|nr:hypothetical protein [Desulfobulbaceae bacterium]